MSFGLQISKNIIESKENEKDWVVDNGIYLTKRQLAAKKAWETRKKNERLKKYKTTSKYKQRKKLIKLMKKSIEEFHKYNIDRYSFKNPDILVLESPELLFAEQLNQELEKDDWFGHSNFYIPNNEEYLELKDNFYKYYREKYNVPYDKISGLRKIRSETTLEYLNLNSFILLNESYKEFFKTCEFGQQENNRTIRHGHRIETIYPSRFSLSFIWADFCSAFSTKQEEIDLTFKSKLLGNHSIFALTFSTRDPGKKKTKNSTMNTIVAVQDYVKKTAKKYGYKVEFLTEESGLYKHHMYSAVFRCIYEPIEKNMDDLVELLKTYYKLHSEVENRLSSIDRKIFKYGNKDMSCKPRWS